MSFYTHDELNVLDEIKELKAVVASGGMTADGVKLTVADAMSMPSAPLVFRRVITEVIQEAIEPTLIASKLLDRIDYEGYGSTITFGTIGSMGTMNLDMAEGSEYPEYSVPAIGSYRSAYASSWLCPCTS